MLVARDEMDEDVEQVPSEADVLGYADSLSNWGRWGADDQLGTLNLITPARRLAALGLVRRGRLVSCARDIDPNDTSDSRRPQRYMIRSGEGVVDGKRVLRHVAASEYIGLIPGRNVTHLDSLSHVFWNGRMYNDLPASLVTTEHGATSHAITVAGDGILTRAVLLDVPRHRGVPSLQPGTPVHRREVETILAAYETDLLEGDALLLRTGHGRAPLAGSARTNHTQAGWGTSCLPLFREAGVAIIGADTAQETHPSGYAGIRGPIHGIGIPAMGMWFLDSCDLEEAADACDEYGVHEFALLLAPLRLVGATVSPMNPIAMF
jgi:kynurenine formamidase